MTTHTKDFQLAYHDETAFCSGGGATANTPTELVEADLTAIDKCVSFNPGIPQPVYSEYFHLASGLTPDLVTYDEMTPGAGSGKFYFQTSILYDWAVSASLGGTGTSKSFRYKSPYANAERDIYGCLCKHWDLLWELKKPAYQSVEWITTRAKIASCTPIAGSGIPAFSSSAIKTWASPAFTIDSQTIANLGITRLQISVDNTFDDGDQAHELASGYLSNPALLERVIEFSIDYSKNNSETWDADRFNSTVQTISATLNFSVFTLSPANYNVWEVDTDNMPERGRIGRTAKFRWGVGATQAKT